MLAEGELAVREGASAANNPRVVKLFADADFSGIKQDSVAWCAAAFGAMLKQAGHKPSGSLAARSYEGWGVGLKEPALGPVATKKRGNSSWQGHVGFVIGANSSQIFLLGGNQGDAWSVAAFPRAEFTAFRWPADVPLPAPHTLPQTIAGARSGVSEA
ncbi:TIGR02594 family protein [Methylorubrum extorquens]|uniref:TIGR02594 family protein n=1 Tax=Methylorubrum extorquens TaxID=408 RepID=A0AAX3WK27_METEX|nr:MULTISPECIES: TIGR02594 family protein [Methylobacteriaceae]WHQ70364.1 TIGR02594 family protein [Methylorubrum extorquens]